MYEPIENDWTEDARHEPSSAKLPPPIAGNGRPVRRYMGYELSTKPRRLLGGLLTYAPYLLCLFVFVPKARDIDSWFTPLWVIALTIAAYWWVFFAAPQHEGQSLVWQNWLRTRVVSMRQDEYGRVRVFYPTTKQLIIRSVMAVFIDIFWGWICVMFSKNNRRFGDLVAGTVVIVEGQVIPELPGEKARGSWK